MIVVTGASGQLGGLVVERLLERTAASEIAVVVRSPGKAAHLADRGVVVRQADADQPETLVRAFEGTDRLLLVSLPRLGQALIEAHAASIDAARRAGVGRLLYTSHIGADLLSPFAPTVGHARTEAMLLESGVPFTSLRNGFYTDTPVQWVQQAVVTGELRLPADGPVSWTTREDLAAATAALLTEPDLDRSVVNLTAGEAVAGERLAALAAEASGRPVRRVEVGDDEFRGALVEAGAPEFGAAMGLSIIAASRMRRMSIVDPELERLIGRPSTPLVDVLRAALA